MQQHLHNLVLRETDWWTIATAALCGVACGVPGAYLVLRRLSMLGDAISHAILPGLAAAFLLTSSRAVVPMFIGALVTGLLAATLSAGVSRLGRVGEDAALGVVFSSLFALGVLLITVASRNVDLDPGCVLYGLIDAVALDRRPVLGFEIPRSFLVLAPMCAFNILVICLFHKELAITAFDPGLATAQGFRAPLVHNLFLGLVAATCVASFEAVGSILVVAMLIVPGATAYLLTDRLSRMLVIAAIAAALSAFLGYLAALTTGAAVAGAVSVMLGVLFTLALLFAPAHGLVPRAVRRIMLAVRIRQEDILADLHRSGETPGAGPATVPAPHASTLLDSLALAALRMRGLIRRPPSGPVLTRRGREAAATVIRSHRLWESYLSEHLRLPANRLHAPAHRMEHYISERMREDLARGLRTDTDPQGKRIP
jgi:manganese/zinc/iron transport system permease protein